MSERPINLSMISDAAESDISLTRNQWAEIQAGGEHIEKSEVYFEGDSEAVTWSFKNGTVTIDGRGGGEWLSNAPISELFVDE